VSPEVTGKITPEDIENRLRGALPDKEESVGPIPKETLPLAAAVGIAVVAVVIGAAFLMGRRKGRRKSTFVEITRL
jgi:hypothetical protein